MTCCGISSDSGDPSGGGGTDVEIEDEGIPQGNANTLDFVGDGVTATVAAGVATISVPGAAVPTVVFEVDFRAEPTQDLTPDGTFSIGGVDWITDNTAGLDGLDIVNGTGLVVDYSAANISPSGGTAASLVIARNELPLYRPGAPTWILVDGDFSGLTANFTELDVGLIESLTNNRYMAAGRTFNSFTTGESMIIRWNFQPNGGGSNTEGEAFDDVLAAFVDGRTAIEMWHSALVGGNLPALAQLDFRRGSVSPSAGAITYGGPGFTTYAHPLATPGFLFATSGTNSAGDSAIIRRMRVLQ